MPYPSPMGLRLDARLLALALGMALGLEAPAGASEIRVLLLQGQDRVEVAPHGGGRPTTVRLRGSSLEVDGERRGSVLRLTGAGAYRVDGRSYRGAIEVRREASGLAVVNEVPLDAYVAGTLLAEVYGSWGREVLRAQAVATRTYALHRRERARDSSHHVEANENGQVYLGMAAESPAAWDAVRSTRGEYLAWEGQPILAAFHSASGGRTASSAEVWGGSLPYLVSVPVEGEEDSPDTYWRARVSSKSLERALRSQGLRIGRPSELRVVERTASGRVASLQVRGSAGTSRIGARQLRQALGGDVLKSTLFEIRSEDGEFLFVGSGRGHGVGMSQWGARALAERGQGYRDILKHFYPGATLRRLPDRAARDEAGAAQVAAGGGR